ncbi:MAG: SapC family protein, partial [Pseudomonadota bacterium]
LFVDDNGGWDALCHVPAYLRCHPFAFARRSDDQYAVVIDRAAASVSDSPQYPFFTDRKLTDEVQSMVDFCAAYDRDRLRTLKICETIKSLGLLAPQRATQTPPGSDEEQVIANYVAVEPPKLDELDKDTLAQIHKDGTLATIFAHLYSLDNWTRLLQRRAALSSAAAS